MTAVMRHFVCLLFVLLALPGVAAADLQQLGSASYEYRNRLYGVPAADGGGTKITVAFAPVCFTAEVTVWKMGTVPWNLVPPRFGVTPATTRVP